MNKHGHNNDINNNNNNTNNNNNSSMNSMQVVNMNQQKMILDPSTQVTKVAILSIIYCKGWDHKQEKAQLKALHLFPNYPQHFWRVKYNQNYINLSLTNRDVFILLQHSPAVVKCEG